MNLIQSPTFFRFVKKVDKKFKIAIDNEIKAILGDPLIGDEKKGDLIGVRVHKFKYLKNTYLIAYRQLQDELQLVMIGTHENFYRDLKGYIKG